MELSTLSDEELMVRVQSGNPQAYELLFQRHSGPLFGYLRRRSGQEELAAELFQETWLKVHRFSGSWRADQPFKPWLYGVALNTARDAGRKSQRRVSTTVLEFDEPQAPSAHARRLTLEQAIDALPEKLKDAFLLGAVHGLDHKEVAEQLEISPANARARISRARAFLRDWLDKRGGAK